MDQGRPIDLVVWPELLSIQQLGGQRSALEAGAYGCSISGAGPAMFAVAMAETGDAVALAMHAAFARHGLSSRYFVCAPDNRGARQVDA